MFDVGRSVFDVQAVKVFLKIYSLSNLISKEHL